MLQGHDALVGLREAVKTAEIRNDNALAAQARAAAVAPLGKARTVVDAQVNHGRWVVICPDVVCMSGQMAARHDARFMCHECFNVAVGGVWRPVRWPDDVDAIDRELDGRPVENRNWTPGESVADLRQQAADVAALERASSDEHRETYAGHTHHWPKRLPDAELVECPECGLTLPTTLVHDDGANASRIPGRKD